MKLDSPDHRLEAYATGGRADHWWKPGQRVRCGLYTFVMAEHPTRQDQNSDDSPINQLVRDSRSGDGQSQERLMTLAYSELQRLAGRYLRRERVGHTLQPTALVHEAYLKLAGGGTVPWAERTHFLAVAAQAMKRVLIDHARGRARAKRGGNPARVTLDEALCPFESPDMDVLALEAALQRLDTLDSRQARIVELRFFSGMTVSEVAEVVGCSKRTVEGEWTHAKAWLRRELSGSP